MVIVAMTGDRVNDAPVLKLAVLELQWVLLELRYFYSFFITLNVFHFIVKMASEDSENLRRIDMIQN